MRNEPFLSRRFWRKKRQNTRKTGGGNRFLPPGGRCPHRRPRERPDGCVVLGDYLGWSNAVPAGGDGFAEDRPGRKSAPSVGLGLRQQAWSHPLALAFHKLFYS